MANVITNIVNDKQDIKNQLGTYSEIYPSVKRFASQVKVRRLCTKVTITNIAGAMIWGSTSYGTWGQDEWGGPQFKSFILNSDTQGILGQNVLGSQSLVEELYAVLPKNNIFAEYFGDDLFINTSNSNGTFDPNNETYTLQAGQVLESEVITKLRTPINKVKFIQHDGISDTVDEMILGGLSLGISTFNDDNAEVQVSNDSGKTWVSLSNITDTVNFDNVSNNDELKYRVIASKDLTITGPLTLKIN